MYIFIIFWILFIKNFSKIRTKIKIRIRSRVEIKIKIKIEFGVKLKYALIENLFGLINLTRLNYIDLNKSNLNKKLLGEKILRCYFFDIVLNKFTISLRVEVLKW